MKVFLIGGGCFLSPRTRLFWVCVQSVLPGVEGGRGSAPGCKGGKVECCSPGTRGQMLIITWL